MSKGIEMKIGFNSRVDFNQENNAESPLRSRTWNQPMVISNFTVILQGIFFIRVYLSVCSCPCVRVRVLVSVSVCDRQLDWSACALSTLFLACLFFSHASLFICLFFSSLGSFPHYILFSFQ